jgi:hypothetical protein
MSLDDAGPCPEPPRSRHALMSAAAGRGCHSGGRHLDECRADLDGRRGDLLAGGQEVDLPRPELLDSSHRRNDGAL